MSGFTNTGVATAPANAASSSANSAISTPALLVAMLRTSSKISDLFFSPGREPLVEVNGRLVPAAVPQARPLTASDTQRIAADLIGEEIH